jgi:hypothetical protein
MPEVFVSVITGKRQLYFFILKVDIFFLLSIISVTSKYFAYRV